MNDKTITQQLSVKKTEGLRSRASFSLIHCLGSLDILLVIFFPAPVTVMLPSLGAIQIPETIGSVAVGYNVPGITTKLLKSGRVLADIFQDKITKRNDPRIEALNLALIANLSDNCFSQ
jgi:hypothetical protein